MCNIDYDWGALQLVESWCVFVETWNQKSCAWFKSASELAWHNKMYSKYQTRCWNVFEKTSCLKDSGIPLAENKAKCQIYENLRETFVHRIWEGSSTKSRTLDCLPSLYFRPLPGTFPKPCRELSWNPAHDLPRTFPEPCKTQPEIFPPNSRAITIGTSPTHVCAPQLLERPKPESKICHVHHSHFSTNPAGMDWSRSDPLTPGSQTYLLTLDATFQEFQ